MRRLVLLSIFLVGCEQIGGGSTTQEPPAPTPATPTLAGADADLPAPGDADAAVVVPGTLPPGWTGTGVLAKSRVEALAGAPAWATIEAEVIEREGKRVLQTTGFVQGVSNPALAQSTAENRARAMLARWLKTNTLAGSQIVGTFQDGTTGSVFARAEVELPEDALR